MFAWDIRGFAGISSCRTLFSVCITSLFLALELFSLVGVSTSVVSLSCCVISFCLAAVSSFRILFSASRSCFYGLVFHFLSCWLMFSIKFLSNVGSVSFRMLVISSLKFLIFKTKFLFILIAFKINSSLKDSSLVIKTQLLTCSDFQQKWCWKMLLYIIYSIFTIRGTFSFIWINGINMFIGKTFIGFAIIIIIRVN